MGAGKEIVEGMAGHATKDSLIPRELKSIAEDLSNSLGLDAKKAIAGADIRSLESFRQSAEAFLRKVNMPASLIGKMDSDEMLETLKGQINLRSHATGESKAQILENILSGVLRPALPERAFFGVELPKLDRGRAQIPAQQPVVQPQAQAQQPVQPIAQQPAPPQNPAELGDSMVVGVVGPADMEEGVKQFKPSARLNEAQLNDVYQTAKRYADSNNLDPIQDGDGLAAVLNHMRGNPDYNQSQLHGLLPENSGIRSQDGSQLRSDRATNADDLQNSIQPYSDRNRRN